MRERKAGYLGNSNAQKSDKPRDGNMSGRVAKSDWISWKRQAEAEGITRTDLIIRLLNNYCLEKGSDE